MRLIAFDPGSSRLGVTVFDNDKVLYCARLKFESNQAKFGDKLDDILEKVYHELQRIVHQYQVTHLCHEIIPGRGGLANYKDFVVSVQSIIKCLAFQYNLSWQKIAANSVKKIVAQDYKASKEAVRDAVKNVYPELAKDFALKYNDWDAFDSVAVGLACRARPSEWKMPKTSNLTGRSW